jgi:transcription antitermination factor NusG
MQTTPPWLAFYTRSRHEKTALVFLEEQGIEAYVPIHTVVRQWSDRKKKVQEPLIRCYLFARPTPLQYYQVLNTPGVVRCIYFEGRPAPIPEEQIRMLRVLVSGKVDVETSLEAFAPGQKVQFVTGPMAGFTGELLEIAGKRKVILRLDHVEQSFLVTADIKLLQVV